jgi:hypothetical protein
MNTGDTVAWKWGNSVAEGVILEIHTERIAIESKGKKIVRIGTPDNPALLIKHASGNPVLKRASEVQRTNQ